MSSFDTTGTASLADVLSILKSVNLVSFPVPDQHMFFEKVRSMLPAMQQSKASTEDTQHKPESAQVDVIDDDDFPVFSDQEYQSESRKRWMASETTEERQSLALEGYRFYWNLGDSTALSEAVIKTLGPCEKQVTAKVGWLHYLQMLACLHKA